MTRRFREVFRVDFFHQLKRPLFWVMVIMAFLVAWSLSGGNVTVSSGDSDVGGTKAHITSQFAQSMQQAIFFIVLYGFFFAIACGMPVIKDDEERVGDILHTTRLTAGEYVWGKYLAPLAAFSIAMLGHALFVMFFNHVVPNADAEKFRGAFALASYFKPLVMFVLPSALFMTGLAFYLGERTRRPILVFLVPVIMWVHLVFIVLGPWVPEDISSFWDHVLMAIDPSGFRWLNQIWLKVDRGVKFYNSQPVVSDSFFLLTRLVYVAIGLGAVALSQRGLERRLRGAAAARSITKRAAGDNSGVAVESAIPSLADLGMRLGRVSLLRQILLFARTEAKNLRHQPGIYLFAPLITVNVVLSSIFGRGWLESEVMITSGTFAVRSFGQVSFWLILLLMFYTIESLQRERSSGIAPILLASPVRTFALLAGKSLANSLVAVAILAATFLGAAIAFTVQKVQLHSSPGLQLGPFILVWGLMLLPTFLIWTGFVSFVFALLRNRYAAYAICLAVVIVSGVLVGFGKMNWAYNWPLWGSLGWSDISRFELDRTAIVLNRSLAITAAIAFLIFAVRFYPRVEADPQRIFHRLLPRALGISAVRGLAVAAVPVFLFTTLAVKVHEGSGGKALENKMKEYRQKNFITWKDAKLPRISSAEIAMTIDPQERGFEMKGSYELLNHQDVTLQRFAVTPNPAWHDLHWTLGGKEFKPEDRAGLALFTPPEPLKPGDRTTLGFSYSGTYPVGISKNGGGEMEFIVPSSVVLTSFGPTFAPWLGFMDSIGVNDDTRLEPKDWPEDAYLGKTKSAFGSDAPYPAKITITGPTDFSFNSVGKKVSDTVAGGKRTVVWQTDYPVTFFNLVGGRWKEWDGEGTKLFYDPRHTYNLDEMGLALNGARRYYSAWFYDYPWETLKVSEFAALATYAQGFPTDITFSEGIGFLTKSDVKSHAAFLVTAHESAHQWWGNLINPGDLPGGNILSEGASHYSTIMLIDQILGDQARIETMKRLEEQYGRNRQIDSEKPLVKIDGTRAGDTTVTYDKGGWVFTMLQNLMGRDANLRGVQAFFQKYVRNDDHPVLQDFVETMRPFAPDQAAYDSFVKQWFFEVVMPEYKLSDVKKVKGGERWTVTATIQNAGTGKMPIEIAAAKGERFEEQKGEQAKLTAAKPDPAYRDARALVTLAADEKQTITIVCDFDPDRLVIDPDVRVLQLRRKDNATFKF